MFSSGHYSDRNVRFAEGLAQQKVLKLLNSILNSRGFVNSFFEKNTSNLKAKMKRLGYYSNYEKSIMSINVLKRVNVMLVDIAIDSLINGKSVTDDELLALLDLKDTALLSKLQDAANSVRLKNYGRGVFLRGLIEVSNFCKNDCLYCGIRCSNKNVERYRLNKEEILKSCETGYGLGLHTFVLQGGEDLFFDNDTLVDIIQAIKNKYPECAVTLSLGERTLESYQRLKTAGADRYLLRQESANQELYSKLHPSKMSLDNRLNCLRNLKALGFQTGSGFMVGAPYQTDKDLVQDLRFLQEIQPEMIGIGPFVPHHETPFASESMGSVDKTILLISILRLLFPKALIPATTSLQTAASDGRARGLKAGANVIMPNLSPTQVRKKYDLYDNKASFGTEACEGIALLKKEIEAAGFEISFARGDAL